jgi:hypothetical protein
LAAPPSSGFNGPLRFKFKIAADTPLKELLPTAPKVKKIGAPMSGEDLARVPEVEFQASPAKEVSAEEGTKGAAYMIARVNHLNARKTDGFLEALRGERPDLAGMPFAMGDACRTKGERSRQFNLAVATVRRALGPVAVTMSAPSSTTGVVPTAPAAVAGSAVAPAPVQAVGSTSGLTSAAVQVPDSGGFWDRYQAACAQEDKAQSGADRVHQEAVTLARIAALMQVLAPQPADVRLGLVKYLSGVAHAEATRALAKMALFAGEDEVRKAAVEALKVRRERDYSDVLLQGLRYPWPTVARRAADALVQLERTDLVPQLVGLLDEPDPRAPVLTEVNHKKVPVVRELVRVNHHRNCLLCHAPGNTGKVAPETLTAAVPIPNEPLPSPADGYRASSPDLLVRIDVTYLRQDFSVLQPVADANPWPEMQRFDFLVRTRVLTEEEADAYREQLTPHEPGRLSPYHRAAVAALRELTGRDAAPTADAWRQLLKLPPRTVRPDGGS